MSENKKRFLIAIFVLLAAAVPVAWHIQKQKTLNRSLISAVSRKDVMAVRNLLAKGANSNAIGPDDFTKGLWNKNNFFGKVVGPLSGWHRLIVKPALIIAVENKDTATVNLLLSSGANVNSRTERDETALMIATDGDKLAILRHLLEAGADINARDNSGNTALTWAAFWNNSQAVEILAHKGADVNAFRSDGDTALMYVASDKDKLKIAALLLRLGADVNHRNSRGQSALTQAKQQKNTPMVKLLKQAGAKH